MSSSLESILLLSLPEKIGQLFFVGIPGAGLDEATIRLLAEVSPGGVCLFARNIKEPIQTRTLLEGLRNALPVEPFLSIDQEGGLVDRLRRIVRPMPAANKIRTRSEATEIATVIAETLRLLGFNMDFAPVVDVINDSRRHATNGLLSRAYGNSAKDVVELAGAFLDSLRSQGCLGCLKHFPGLGASEVDSHEELPSVRISGDEFNDVDLYPYKNLLMSRPQPAVMAGHACYPDLDLQERDQDGKLLPSSLSESIISGLLRNDLGFDGLVITDDLEMGAIVKNYGIGDACIMALEAGVDMLAICAGVDSIYEGFRAVLDATASGRIAEGRIDRSLHRIAAAKAGLSEPLPWDPSRLTALSEQIDGINARLN